MSRRKTYELSIEMVLDTEEAPGVPLFHVEGYGSFPELWLYPSDTGELLATAPIAGLDGCRLPRAPAPWPPLCAIVARAFPEVPRGVVLWDDA